MERNHRVVFRAVLLVGFCWFLLFAGLNSRGATRQDGLSVNNVSKRRVPNGSDPIHNRPKLARRSTSVHGPKSCTRDSCAGAGSLWLLRLRGRPLAARRGGRVSCGAVGLRRRRREGLKVGKGAEAGLGR
ncbi:hypothetical protein R6Q59_005590 [Mikania micrantha]